jgi:hypothetical protein
MWSRLRRSPFRFSVALGIVIVSILTATMAWRASVWSERSSNTDELTRQDTVQEQQLRATLSQNVAQDIRVFGRYEEHSLRARELERDARRVRGSALARELEREAAEQRTLAKALRAYFVAGQPIDALEGDGVEYNPEFTLRTLVANETELETLRPRELREEAREAHLKAVRLTGLAVLFVAALLFLTLAEVTRTAVSRLLAGAGAGVALIALGLFFLV